MTDNDFVKNMLTVLANVEAVYIRVPPQYKDTRTLLGGAVAIPYPSPLWNQIEEILKTEQAEAGDGTQGT